MLHFRLPFWCLCLTACGSTREWTLTDPGQLAPEQRKLLVEAEPHYRKGEPFTDQRQAIAADPVAAWWWTRMVVRDVFATREGRITGSDSQKAYISQLPEFLAAGRKVDPRDSDLLLAATAGKRDPVEVRARAELAALGEAAVPCLIHDLARHPQAYVRQIGVELLGAVGAAAMPAIERDLLAAAEPVHRRTGVQALGQMPTTVGSATRILQVAKDTDYGVRAAAFASLPENDPAAAAALRRALAEDDDAFVRRTAAKALGAQRETASAQALVGYLQQCEKAQDKQGAQAAQDALQRLARKRGVRSLEDWRAFAATFAPQRG